VYGDWRHQFHHLDCTTSLGEVVISGQYTDVLESLLGNWWVAPVALLFRRKIVERAGGWDETLQAGQDRDFFISVALTGADIRYQPGCDSIYRRYEAVTVSTVSHPRWRESQERLLRKAEARLQQMDRLSPTYRAALARSYFVLARLYYDLDRQHYRVLLDHALALYPDLQPRQSFSYDMTQRLFGFAAADRLASAQRRGRARLKSWLPHAKDVTVRHSS
jgi:hypothetical protein